MLVKISVTIILSMFRTETANVVNTYETDNNTVSVIETSDGNIWEVGDELSAGKTYSVTFNTNGTETVLDDMVISVKECE